MGYTGGAACTGFVFAVKSRAAGMSRLPQLIHCSIAIHSMLVQNHCQLINAMFFSPPSSLPHFLYIPFFINLFHFSLSPRGNQCFIYPRIPCCFLEIYFCNPLLAQSDNSFRLTRHIITCAVRTSLGHCEVSVTHYPLCTGLMTLCLII